MILFNMKDTEYGWLSNLYPCRINYKGYEFRNVEAFYQVMKYEDPLPHIETFQDLDGWRAKELGKGIKLRSDWQDIKDKVMEVGVRLKFGQRGRMIHALTDTANEDLYHLSPWDLYWGVDDKLNGLNKLGELIMKQREINATQAIHN